MAISHITPSHARELVAQITLQDDAAHKSELIELIEGVAEPDNEAAQEACRYLRGLGDCNCDCLLTLCAALYLALEHVYSGSQFPLFFGG
jgi:hypothetical protein